MFRGAYALAPGFQNHLSIIIGGEEQSPKAAESSGQHERVQAQIFHTEASESDPCLLSDFQCGSGSGSTADRNLPSSRCRTNSNERRRWRYHEEDWDLSQDTWPLKPLPSPRSQNGVSSYRNETWDLSGSWE